MWRRVRRLHLAEHPLCEDCAAKQIHKAAWTVHHLDENQYNNAPENLWSLCFLCHEKRHGRVRDPAGYDEEGYPLHEGHPWKR